MMIPNIFARMAVLLPLAMLVAGILPGLLAAQARPPDFTSPDTIPAPTSATVTQLDTLKLQGHTLMYFHLPIKAQARNPRMNYSPQPL